METHPDGKVWLQVTVTDPADTMTEQQAHKTFALPYLLSQREAAVAPSVALGTPFAHRGVQLTCVP